MICAFLTLALLLGGILLAAFFACRRIGRHVAQHPESVKPIVEHIVLPLLKGEAQQPIEVETQPKPEVKKIKGTLI